MPKPIAIIYIPLELSHSSGKLATWADCRNIQESFDKDKPDYYWLCLLDSDAERVDLKVFFEKDFTEIQYQELKEIVEKKIAEQSNKE